MYKLSIKWEIDTNFVSSLKWEMYICLKSLKWEIDTNLSQVGDIHYVQTKYQVGDRY